MAFADGTIRIDTSIDTKGMAKGTKSISSSLSGVMRSLKGFAALMGVAFSAAAIGNFVKPSVASFNLMGTAFGDAIKRLTDSFALFKSALTNAVMASLNALAPYIIIAVNWLTKLLTIVAQVVTALFLHTQFLRALQHLPFKFAVALVDRSIRDVLAFFQAIVRF